MINMLIDAKLIYLNTCYFTYKDWRGHVRMRKKNMRALCKLFNSYV